MFAIKSFSRTTNKIYVRLLNCLHFLSRFFFSFQPMNFLVELYLSTNIRRHQQTTSMLFNIENISQEMQICMTCSSFQRSVTTSDEMILLLVIKFSQFPTTRTTTTMALNFFWHFVCVDRKVFGTMVSTFLFFVSLFYSFTFFLKLPPKYVYHRHSFSVHDAFVLMLRDGRKH